jgi:hypothetical protein
MKFKLNVVNWAYLLTLSMLIKKEIPVEPGFDIMFFLVILVLVFTGHRIWYQINLKLQTLVRTQESLDPGRYRVVSINNPFSHVGAGLVLTLVPEYDHVQGSFNRAVHYFIHTHTLPDTIAQGSVIRVTRDGGIDLWTT